MASPRGTGCRRCRSRTPPCRSLRRSYGAARGSGKNVAPSSNDMPRRSARMRSALARPTLQTDGDERAVEDVAASLLVPGDLTSHPDGDGVRLVDPIPYNVEFEATLVHPTPDGHGLAAVQSFVFDAVVVFHNPVCQPQIDTLVEASGIEPESSPAQSKTSTCVVLAFPSLPDSTGANPCIVAEFRLRPAKDARTVPDG